MAQHDDQITAEDLHQIWEWNASVPASVLGGVHDLVAELAVRCPAALAVDAWDGALTYGQLDHLADKLAGNLSRLGISVGSIVPMYFRKSKWSPIAMLGIIKSGAAAVALDVNYPPQRLQEIVCQTKARLVVTSPDLRSELESILHTAVDPVSLSESALQDWPKWTSRHLATPNDPVYITFTSGSGGTPKGAVISHANVRSAVHHQSRLLGFHKAARVLDFAPYSFDVAWSNFMHTLCNGGCLCIAKEEDMYQDLRAVIVSYRCTLLNITPTVLRTVQPGPTPLETILLSGEMPYSENIATWASRVRLLNTYGPAECTFKSSFSVLDSRQTARPSVGVGVGMNTWLVDPNDHSKLVPIGIEGELLLEGPLVGQGYLGDVGKTAASFITDPSWLLAGNAGSKGRPGRLYKTGDMMRYESDGRLVFMGRKESTQLKIRGQRVEIQDVEYHARRLVPDDIFIVVDLLKPHDSDSTFLALFVQTAGRDLIHIRTVLDRLAKELPGAVPAFMIPNLYTPIATIPIGSTGKTDRRRLREMGSQRSLRDLLEAQAMVLTRAEPVDTADALEQQLRAIWAQVLGLPENFINPSDNFLRLGGDSLKAIRVVSASRDRGFSITFADVFQAESLRALAKKATFAPTGATSAGTAFVQPFSLLGQDIDLESARRVAADACGINGYDIEDILPATPMQEGLMAMTSLDADSNVFTTCYKLPLDLDTERLRYAWLKVVEEAAILRTRIVDLPSLGLAQVVLKQAASLDQYLNLHHSDEVQTCMGLGTPLSRVLLRPTENGAYELEVRLHHAVFDGWSRSLILRAVQKAYEQESEPLQLEPFQPFVKHVLERATLPEMKRYWREQLSGSGHVTFPAKQKDPGFKLDIHHDIADLSCSSASTTMSSILHASIALLVAMYTNSREVIFGTTLSGRQAPIPFIEQVSGPTMASVPVRVNLDMENTVEYLQQSVHSQLVEMHGYEQFGLQNIHRAVDDPDLDQDGLFQLLLVVQQEFDEVTDRETGLFAHSIGSRGTSEALGVFNPYSMAIVCSLTDSSMRLHFNFDSKSLSMVECQRFVTQLEHIVRIFCLDQHRTLQLRDLSIAAQDLGQICEWNGKSVPHAEQTIVGLIEAQVNRRPDGAAIEAWDGLLTFKQLWDSVTRLMTKLRLKGVKQGDVVLLCLEKCSWMPVSMLAVMRLGATAVPLSSSVSIDHVRNVVSVCKPTMAITSKTMQDSLALSRQLPTVTIDCLSELGPKTDPDSLSLDGPTARAQALSDTAVIVFSSGTTGVPKGIVWSCETLATNAYAAVDAFRISQESRVFQFASYDFDVSIVETVATLSAGGCVCVPCESDCLDDLDGAIRRTNSNWLCLTPSVAALLTPTSAPCIHTLVFAGEQLRQSIASAWIQAGVSVFNWYGPAEASVATFCNLTDLHWPAGLVGRSASARTWILNPFNSSRLAPVGTIGELCIESPVVAGGYIGVEGGSKDQKAFCRPQAIEQAAREMSRSPYRAFRSGDYAKYAADGSIILLGREAGSWVKLRGKRIHLEAIEEIAQSFTGDRSGTRFVADIVRPQDDETESLILFVGPSRPSNMVHGPEPLESPRVSLCFPVDAFFKHLAAHVPRHMHPRYIVPVDTIPTGHTGKVDRARIRRHGRGLRSSQLLDLQKSQDVGESPSSPTAKLLQRLWASILPVPLHLIYANSHFFRLGADSITAMRLSSLARGENLMLTTKQIFQHPILEDMAAVTSVVTNIATKILPAFSLLAPQASKEKVCVTAAQLCNVTSEAVVNVYPCTPMQSGLLALTSRSPGQYTSRSVLDLQRDVDPTRLGESWLATVNDLPILRTRIVDLPVMGLVQVVLDKLRLKGHTNVSDYIREDERLPMSLGTDLCRAAIIDRAFVLTIHHSIYDGSLLSMIMQKLEAKYFDKTDLPVTPFENFVEHTSRIGTEQIRSFWEAHLGVYEWQLFPTLPTAIYKTQANRKIERSIALDWPRDGNTPSTVIRSAWALLAAQYSASTAIMFGVVLSGREVDMPGIENCGGPTVCTVPFAVRVDLHEKAVDFQSRLLKQNLDLIPYASGALASIPDELSNKYAQGLFHSLLVVQPMDQRYTLDSGSLLFKPRSFSSTMATRDRDPFNNNALMISCWLEPSGLRITMSFDDHILSAGQAESLTYEFEGIIRDMCDCGTRTVGEINMVSRDALMAFWKESANLQAEARAVALERENSRSTTGDSQDLPPDQDTMLTSGQDTMPDLSLYESKAVDTFVSETGPNSYTGRSRWQAAILCGVPENDVEDLCRCTSLQESLIASTELSPGRYVGLNVFVVPPNTDLMRLRKAWDAVVSAAPILRTRIVDIGGVGLTQVILRKTSWSTARTLAQFQLQESQRPISLGKPLVRYGLVQDEETEAHQFVLTMHHAVYDAVTQNLIREALEIGLEQVMLKPFRNFVDYTLQHDIASQVSFWKSQLEALEASQFPALPSETYRPAANASYSHAVTRMAPRKDDIVAPTIVRAAWALLCSKYTDSTDVVFGAIVSGRQAPIDGIHQIAGPTIAAVPVRIKLTASMTVGAFLKHVQSQAIEMIPFEHTGIPRIAKINEDARRACNFQSMLVIQPSPAAKEASRQRFALQPQQTPTENSYHSFNSHALLVVCEMGTGEIQFDFSFDTAVIDENNVAFMAEHFGKLIIELSQANPQRLLLDIDMTTSKDRYHIHAWNSQSLFEEQIPVHHLISKVAASQPEELAISAWDGDFTYRDLEKASDYIAHRLLQARVERGQVVPLCFEKSKWTSVAYFGVLKAGAAVLMLDASLPEARLFGMIQQTKSRLIMSSIKNKRLCQKLASAMLVVESEVMDADSEQISCGDTDLPLVRPDDLLCIVFTSGSTGAPKGCMLSHSNFSTALIHQTRSHGLKTGSRMYDFASYSFDASHWNLLHCLAAGGVLCVPSEEQRRSSLADSLRHFAATDLMLTPTVARTLSPDQIPTLENLYLGGEKVSRQDLAQWHPKVRCFVVYGPAECAVLATSWETSEPLPEQIPIGQGIAQLAWIVDPSDEHKLAPIGTVGELYLESHLVGLGYIGDEANTRASFKESPIWLSEMARRGDRKPCRVYKTGDLVKYHPSNGLILFVGRRDAQIKLNGQRLQMGEVEWHVRQALLNNMGDVELAADLVTPKVTGRSALVVFLHLSDHERRKLQEHLPDLETALRDRLPSYAIPSAYVPVETLPLNASGKLDRKRLKIVGEELTLDQLVGSTATTEVRVATTEHEIRMQRLWAIVLNLPLDVIGTESNFFRSSGDSISAMQLTSLAKAEGYVLTVSDILTHPRLADMAKMMHEVESSGATKTPTQPFSLLNNPGNADQVREEVSHLCGVAAATVEDVYPCTALQTSLLAASSRRSGGYVAHLWLELVDDIDIERLKRAWDSVSRTAAPILRNSAVTLPNEGFVQAQLADPIQWNEYYTIDAAQQDIQNHTMRLGTAMTRIVVVKNERKKDHKNYCILSQHHAIYDAASIRLLLNEVGHTYAGVRQNKPVAPFQDFIRYKLGRNKEKERDFWAQQFSNCEAVPFPALPKNSLQVQADSTASREIVAISWPDAEVTKSTVIRAVWTILCMRYTDSLDTVFGILSTGRQVPVADVENMIAPLIAAIPLRVKLEPEVTVLALLLQLQRQAVEMIPYEQSELSEIQKASKDASLGAFFNSLLIVQHHGQEVGFAVPGGPFAALGLARPDDQEDSDTELNHFNPHALMVMCQLRETGSLSIELNYDSRVIDPAQAELLLGHFEQVLRQLGPRLYQKVEAVDPVSEQDLELIWSWNSPAPEAKTVCVHDLIATATESQLASEAICAWDGGFTYEELRDISDRLAHRLVARGLGRGAVVPLFFEKSRWMPVAALAVIKAGAGCLALDVTQPQGRLRGVIANVVPKLSLASSGNEEMTRSVTGADVIVVDDALISQDASSTGLEFPKVDPLDVLYLVATSGSTGAPKLIVTLHENFASAALHQSEALMVKRGTRVFDFVSYSFDVAWSNLLNTLICGGCLCIPSETQRKDNIAQAFNDLNAEYAYFTPSVARSLDPFSMPGLRVLVMGGELIPSAEVARWKQVDTVVGTYGPAECAQALCITPLGGRKQGYLGKSLGARTWLIKPDRPEVLAPIGAVGELIIEGPTVAQGYWKNEKLTQAVFLEQAPGWLSHRAPGHPSRHGRLYKTGDLLRYNNDGSLSFVGRKDQLVKLRGQRVELSEVEHHVQKRLADFPNLAGAIAAEVVQPSDSKTPILAVFIGTGQKESPSSQTNRLSRLSRILNDIEDDLRDVLPLYMMPSAYIPLDTIPVTTTNKIDRRALRETGAKQTLEEMTRLHSSGTSQQLPNTEMETTLQKLWSSILGIGVASIKSQSSFLRIGGESISAMRLVAAAREAGLSFSVADVFRNPRLCDLAKVAKRISNEREVPVLKTRKAFSLLSIAQDDVMEYLQDVVEPLLTGVEAEDIQDILPVTDFQDMAVYEALQEPPGRLPHWILTLPPDVDFSRLRWSCKRLIEHFDILRSVFVKLEGDRLWQVQASHLKPLFRVISVNEEQGESVDNAVSIACLKDLEDPRRLGKSFVGFIVVKSPLRQDHKLIFRLSHAQFDGFSFGATLDVLSALYLGDKPPVPRASFADYVCHNHQRKAHSLEYWRRRLENSSFPSWSGAAAVGDPEGSIQDRLSVVVDVPCAMTRGLRGLPGAAIFHAACAMVLATEFGQDDAIFGRLVTGRSMLPSALQGVVGPCLLEVPIRYRRGQCGDNEDIWAVAHKFHLEFIEGSSHESAGMREIIRQGTSWPADQYDNFGWRTAYQQEEDEVFSFLGQEKAQVKVFDRSFLPRRRPELYATPSKGRLELRFEGSKKIISEVVAKRVLTKVAELLSSCSNEGARGQM